MKGENGNVDKSDLGRKDGMLLISNMITIEGSEGLYFFYLRYVDFFYNYIYSSIITGFES